jgi:hypothetical protein
MSRVLRGRPRFFLPSGFQVIIIFGIFGIFWYLHLEEGTFYRVNGLAYLEDPECYAGDSVATGRVSLAGQDEGERSDEERYLVPPCWRLRRWTSTSTLENNVF